MDDTFDFPAFVAALEAKDVDAWSSFYAEDAEWLEYRERNPPRSPNRMIGRPEITTFITGVAASPVTLHVSHEVIAPERAAFRLTVRFTDGREIIEHVILELDGGRIVTEVDVEAWD